MRLRKIHYFKWVLIVSFGWGPYFAGVHAEGASKGRKAKMSIEEKQDQVIRHLDAFQRNGDPNELRAAADLIDGIDDAHIAAFDERQSSRAVKLGLWLTLLEKIDLAKDPQFDPLDVPAARVLVPPGTPMKPGVPIESPEGIANPADLRNYEQSVKANEDKTRHYRIQKELRQMDAELSTRADTYIQRTLLRSPQSVRKLNDALAKNTHNQDRAAHLRSLVAP